MAISQIVYFYKPCSRPSYDLWKFILIRKDLVNVYMKSINTSEWMYIYSFKEKSAEDYIKHAKLIPVNKILYKFLNLKND